MTTIWKGPYEPFQGRETLEGYIQAVWESFPGGARLRLAAYEEPEDREGALVDAGDGRQGAQTIYLDGTDPSREETTTQLFVASRIVAGIMRAAGEPYEARTGLYSREEIERVLRVLSHAAYGRPDAWELLS